MGFVLCFVLGRRCAISYRDLMILGKLDLTIEARVILGSQNCRNLIRGREKRLGIASGV